MNIATILGLIVGMAYLSAWIGRHLGQLAPYFLFRLILFPGIILHESAHVIGCVLTGAHIRNVNFWTQNGGEVVHTQPKIPLIGQPIISFAPFIVGIAALIALSRYVIREPITLDWYRLTALFLMLSISATLMPSKQDIQNSWWSALFLVIVLVGTFVTWPQTFTWTNNLLEPLIEPFVFVTFVLLGLVVSTKLFTLKR